jgi:uncharacterized tellurite resistance protein B-like protein
MKFNLVEKLAVIKAIDEVIRVDSKIRPEELDYMEQLADLLDFDSDHILEAREVEASEAVAVLKAMPKDKQQSLVRLMTEAANADGEVDEKEIRFIYRMFSAAGIEPEI